MEEVLEAIKELMTEIKDVQKEQRAYTEYIKEIVQENKEMKKEINELQERIQQLEKEKTKNNLIITGLKIETEDENEMNEVIKDFVKKELEMEVKVRKTRKITNKKYIIEMQTFNDKIKILKAKSKLRNIKNKIIYIDEDLPKKEREIQRQILKRAKEERENGKRVKVGHRKMTVNGKEWKWDSAESKLKEVKDTNCNNTKN